MGANGHLLHYTSVIYLGVEMQDVENPRFPGKLIHKVTRGFATSILVYPRVPSGN